jgi:hypothetical protein
MPSLQGMIMPASWNQNRLTAKLGIKYIPWTDPVRFGLAALAQLLRRLNANVDRPTATHRVD